MAERKTTVRIGIGLAVLALALAVFAWQQGDDGGGGGPLNAIAAAAERTQSEPGGRTTMRAVVTAQDPSESLVVTGRGVYDDAMERTQLVMEMRDPESGDLVEMEVVTDGSVLYMATTEFGDLPDGRSWMSFDLSAVPGFVDAEIPVEGDPKAELEMLKEATGARKIGKQKVRGVQTTRYAGVLDGEGAPTELEVWIDAEGLIRRIRILGNASPEEGKGPAKMDMEMDFFDFGPVPAIEVPAEDEVFDATSLAEEELDA